MQTRCAHFLLVKTSHSKNSTYIRINQCNQSINQSTNQPNNQTLKRISFMHDKAKPLKMRKKDMYNNEQTTDITNNNKNNKQYNRLQSSFQNDRANINRPKKKLDNIYLTF